MPQSLSSQDASGSGPTTSSNAPLFPVDYKDRVAEALPAAFDDHAEASVGPGSPWRGALVNACLAACHLPLRREDHRVLLGSGGYTVESVVFGSKFGLVLFPRVAREKHWLTPSDTPSLPPLKSPYTKGAKSAASHIEQLGVARLLVRFVSYRLVWWGPWRAFPESPTNTF
jgi:hypothetical protein